MGRASAAFTPFTPPCFSRASLYVCVGTEREREEKVAQSSLDEPLQTAFSRHLREGAKRVWGREANEFCTLLVKGSGIISF